MKYQLTIIRKDVHRLFNSKLSLSSAILGVFSNTGLKSVNFYKNNTDGIYKCIYIIETKEEVTKEHLIKSFKEIYPMSIINIYKKFLKNSTDVGILNLKLTKKEYDNTVDLLFSDLKEYTGIIEKPKKVEPEPVPTYNIYEMTIATSLNTFQIEEVKDMCKELGISRITNKHKIMYITNQLKAKGALDVKYCNKMFVTVFRTILPKDQNIFDILQNLFMKTTVTLDYVLVIETTKNTFTRKVIENE